MNAPRESDVLRQVRQLLGHYGAVCVRVNCGGRTLEYKGRKRYVSFNSTPGCADALVCFRGKFLAVETKRQGGRQTADQRAFQGQVEAAGGVYLLVSDAVQLLDWLEAQG